jgi:hypothetical protein
MRVDKNGNTIRLGLKNPVKFEAFMDKKCKSHHIYHQHWFAPYLYSKSGDNASIQLDQDASVSLRFLAHLSSYWLKQHIKTINIVLFIQLRDLFRITIICIL